MPFREQAERLLAVGREYPHVHFDVPAALSRNMSFDMPASEMTKVGAILREADCLLCWFSSTMIEASIFDTPVVNVALHPKRGIPTEEQMKYEHLSRILRTGAARTAFTEPQMIDAIRDCLRSPETGREGRRAVVDREVGPFRGEAGRRVGEHILRVLEGEV
jgi:hypothetical protein